MNQRQMTTEEVQQFVAQCSLEQQSVILERTIEWIGTMYPSDLHFIAEHAQQLMKG